MESTFQDELFFKPLHVGISVPDMDDAKEWYIKILGCTEKSDRYIQKLKARVVFLYLGDFQIELFQHDNSSPLPEERKTPDTDITVCGTKHICFQVGNMDLLVEHFLKNDVDLASDVFVLNGNKVLFIRDCAGNIIEFIEKN